ncbi:MAG: PA0069 family radical SAM protein [Pseudomonadota bacterium]|nr:PA0069 family radical SAM protein [Pseudomonadota bacterium]
MPLKTTAGNHGEAAKGRGATINPEGRFETLARAAVEDGWFQEPDEDASRPKTVIAIERAKSVISRHDSPDVGFSQSINPYRGCGHGCVYCFARPSHAYLGLSPGIDFETRLSAKTNAADVLREEIAKPGYRCEPLTIGVNTDAYQPIEREYRITRAILELCHETGHPVSLITKSALIERDIDLLAPMAKDNLVSATLSVTTLDHGISRYMEPRTSAPTRRLLAIKRLAEAGIPVNVNVAPVIPFLTDSELEPIMEAAARAGARSAGYVLVRLPWEVKDLFRAWLEERFPLKAAHVMSRIHEMRGGRDNDPNFGSRMTGQGLFAQLLAQRFEKARVRFGLNDERGFEMDCSRFRPPDLHGQSSLF